MSVNSLHFIRPYWFLAVIPALILIIMYIRNNNAKKNAWANHCDPDLLPYITDQSSQQKNYTLAILVGLAWLIMIIALAGPSWTKYQEPVYQKKIGRVIALDLSPVMNATDVSPSRLERAKFKILDLLKTLQEGQTGMIVFTSLPFVVSPLTNDSNTIAAMVPTIDSSIVPVQGTDIAKALLKSQQLLAQAGFNRGEILLITASSPNNQDIAMAAKLAANGYTTSVLAIGSADGGPIKNKDGGLITDAKGNIIVANLDSSSLAKLANSGNGTFIPYSNDNSDINKFNAIYRREQIADTPSKIMESQNLWQEYGYWFIWGLIPILALLARKGWIDKLC